MTEDEQKTAPIASLRGPHLVADRRWLLVLRPQSPRSAIATLTHAQVPCPGTLYSCFYSRGSPRGTGLSLLSTWGAGSRCMLGSLPLGDQRLKPVFHPPGLILVEIFLIRLDPAESGTPALPNHGVDKALPGLRLKTITDRPHREPIRQVRGPIVDLDLEPD